MLIPRWIADSEAVLLDLLSLDWTMNNGNAGRGGSYWPTNRERRDLGMMMTNQKRLGGDRPPYADPVMLVISRVMGAGERKWDTDSGLRGTAKQLIDAMVAADYFHSDARLWISHVAVTEDDHEREMGPAMRVAIFSDVYEEIYIDDAPQAFVPRVYYPQERRGQHE